MYVVHEMTRPAAAARSHRPLRPAPGPDWKLTMFRLLRLLLILGIGVAIGIWFERTLMKSECRAGEGQWTGTICLNSELLQ